MKGRKSKIVERLNNSSFIATLKTVCKENSGIRPTGSAFSIRVHRTFGLVEVFPPAYNPADSYPQFDRSRWARGGSAMSKRSPWKSLNLRDRCILGSRGMGSQGLGSDGPREKVKRIPPGEKAEGVFAIRRLPRSTGSSPNRATRSSLKSNLTLQVIRRPSLSG